MVTVSYTPVRRDQVVARPAPRRHEHPGPARVVAELLVRLAHRTSPTRVEELSMESTEMQSGESLHEILSARALRTPMDRLLIDLIGGSLLLAASLWAQPPGWVVLSSAATCLLSYGSWAIAERRVQPRPWPESIPFESLWRVVQVVASVVGIAGFALLLFAMLGLALGSIVS